MQYTDLLNLEDRVQNLTLGIEINIEFVMLYWQVSNLENDSKGAPKFFHKL